MAHFALMYSDTGGGHRTAAEAIAMAIERAAPGAHRITLANGVGWLPFPFNRSVQTYAASMRRAPWLHALNYRLLDGDGRRRLAGSIGMALDGRRAMDFVRDTAADVFVSCQPHFNPFAPRAIRRAGLKARYAHAVTDLMDLHAFHFAPGADLLAIPTAEARAEAMRHGIPPDRLLVAGYPILPDFAERVAGGGPARRALGLDEALPTLLLIGGGEGMGDLRETAAALLRSGLPAQLVVVCGRNEALQSVIQADASGAAMPARVLGFVENVPELMGACDIIITKAGTGTLCEALAAGRPVILFDAVPGQEDGNREYVVAREAAAWRPSSQAVARQAAEWLADPAARARAAANAQAIARPGAAMDIARALIALALS